jgi:hypothetical protein
MEYNYTWDEFTDADLTELPGEFTMSSLNLSLDVLNQKQMASMWVCVYEYQFWTPDEGQIGAGDDLEGWVLGPPECYIVNYEVVGSNYSPTYTSSYTTNGEMAHYTATSTIATSPTNDPLLDEEYLHALNVVKSELGTRLHPREQNYLDRQLVVTMQNYWFLKKNMFTEEAKDFSAEAVSTEMAFGEVDFEEQVILDKSFIDNDCLYGVYTAMGKATKFKEYLQNFEPNGSIADLRFTTDDNFATNRETKYHNAMAITDAPISSNEIKRTFNTDINTSGDITNKPDVFKAVAMIHEILHAEMYRKMLDAVRAAEISGNNLNWTNWTSEQFYNDFLNSLENKYFGIFDYFTRYNYGILVGSNPNDYQHQQMAQHYRDVVKQALTDYDPTLTATQKEAISWIGLDTADIVAWQILTPSERTAINNLQSQILNTFSNGCN